MKRKFLLVILIVTMLLLIMMPIGLTEEKNLTNIQENRTESELIVEEDSAIDFVYSISEGEVTITRYRNKKAEVKIPSMIDGCPVTSIGSDAFRDCSSITNVIIPNTVVNIESKVFFGCSSLTNITIPRSVNNMMHWAFWGCSNLTSINVDSNNQKYSSENGILFNKDKTEIIKYPEGKEDSNYVISNNVTQIGPWAFFNCRNLKNMTISNCVKSIGSMAFYECTSLTNIDIPNSVTNMGDHTFYGCSSLTNITIPSSVTCIGENTFQRCTGLTTIMIPNSVKTIKRMAFEGCKNFTIYTYRGAYAQTYGNENNINVVLLDDCLLGDMDGDGEITPYDAYIINVIFESGRIPTEQELLIGDVDGDGELTPYDAYIINVAFERGENIKRYIMIKKK